MRNLLIATAALSLIGGAAFAQNSSMTTPQSDSPNAQTPAGSGQSAGDTMPANADGARSTPPATPTPSDSSMSTPSTADTTSAPAQADGSSAMASAAPESYPVCTSKHEDRCVNPSQATRTAMVHRHMRSHTTTTETQPSGM